MRKETRGIIENFKRVKTFFPLNEKAFSVISLPNRKDIVREIDLGISSSSRPVLLNAGGIKFNGRRWRRFKGTCVVNFAFIFQRWLSNTNNTAPVKLGISGWIWDGVESGTRFLSDLKLDSQTFCNRLNVIEYRVVVKSSSGELLYVTKWRNRASTSSLSRWSDLKICETKSAKNIWWTRWKMKQFL